MIMNPYFCILPWSHLYVHYDGKVYTCCRALRSPPVGDLNQESIRKIWNAEPLKVIRANMRQGIRNPQCQECHLIEKNGEKSVRQEFLHHYQEEIAQIVAQQYAESPPLEGLRFINISPSNNCVLSCRTCSPTGSRNWKESLGVAADENNNPALGVSLSAIKPVLGECKNLDRISICGGEPLLGNDHLDLLSAVPSFRRCNIELMYNSNLSVITNSEMCFDTWRQFKAVKIFVSCDATLDQFEFIRTGHRWDRLVSNLNHIRTGCPSVDTYAYITYSLLNFFYLPEILTELLESRLFSIDKILFNLLYEPQHYYAPNAPAALKAKAKKKYLDFMRRLLLSYDYDEALRLIVPMKMLLNYLEQPPQSVDGFSRFVTYGQAFDHVGWKTKPFSELFPDFLQF